MRAAPGFEYRLSNTRQPLGQLLRDDRAILLENALLDTDFPTSLAIPEALRAGADPGSYIVQARGALDESFRDLLRRAGAAVVAYIPNNAYLVRASTEVARAIAADAQTRAVLAYAPYFKLKPSLLKVVLGDNAAESQVTLNALLFADARDGTLAAMAKLEAEVSTEENSPFGSVVRLRTRASRVAALASLSGVQELEFARPRVPANDLSRPALGVATNSVTGFNYLGLTGSNVLVSVVDSGVDTNQPGLVGRVVAGNAFSGADTNGHGTHIAGIIAGSGAQSDTVTNAAGSLMPASPLQFRGMAPETMVFSVCVDLTAGAPAGDSWLQQTVAQTNALIANNSWHYLDDNEYDLAAASYDAAVRDALPTVTGSQPLLCVFAAGNSGSGAADGTGGAPNTIQSPATAKNVLTVGAVEAPRFITSQTWTCAGADCQTNTPWLPATDSGSQVASFSSRGNVGIGVEGEHGRFKPDVVAPGTFVISTRSTMWNETAYYAISNSLFTATPDANYGSSLSNLNVGLGPFYRYESGTSLAAADVSGTLALMQEFCEQRLGRTNSPALMKALLINGARQVGPILNPQVHGQTNAQGWGMVSLPRSIPVALTNLNATTNTMFLVEQDPERSLATGQSHTRYLTVLPEAQNQPLRFTLVWTDPPGNPSAAVKLVNDLDLVVTNLDSGEVFVGNDIDATNQFGRPWSGVGALNSDCVNNVENVFLCPPVGSNYSVTVVGRHVNVNAVTAHTNNVVQDYALVLASGDGTVADALVMAQSSPVSVSASQVTTLTNTFSSSSGDSGVMLLHQRLGANAPLLSTLALPFADATNMAVSVGQPPQWHFYVLSNAFGYTNAAFLTFQPAFLSLPPPLTSSTNASVSEPDIDLYVSTDFSLTNLDPVALTTATRSVLRGGTETLVLSNAIAANYYVGVKSESQSAAEYGFLGVFGQLPFVQVDQNGNEFLRGIQVPASIPSGTPTVPGGAHVFCVTHDSFQVRRVIATDVLTHPDIAQLRGTLFHAGRAATLFNHSMTGSVSGQLFQYDDSSEGDLPGAQPSTGPGSLRDFSGLASTGQWRFDVLSTNLPGTNDDFSLLLEPQQDLSSNPVLSVAPGACREEVILVPLTASNLTVAVTFASGSGPISLELYPAANGSSNSPVIPLASQYSSTILTADQFSLPPLSPGIYRLRICNSGPDAASVNVLAQFVVEGSLPAPVRIGSGNPLLLPDDALCSSTLLVTNTGSILSVEASVRIEHPRVSDLALWLVGPDGTRALLAQNRGGASTNGLGLDLTVTNVVTVPYVGGPEAVTNVIAAGAASGTVLIEYNFYDLPDTMHVYYETNLIFDSGLVSNSGLTNIAYGPGLSTNLVVVMNEGGNTNSDTRWWYRFTCTRSVPMCLTFTEDTNLTITPIKFASVPFTNLTTFPSGSNGVFVLPEESLAGFNGKSAAGPWQLDIWDSRVGATNPPPTLREWQLAFRLRDSVPVARPISGGAGVTNLLGPGQLQWFTLDVPRWVRSATNQLLAATGPLNLLFNQLVPPQGGGLGDFTLLTNATSGVAVLLMNSSPPLVPGAAYYLGVQNTNAQTVSFALQVDFDVPGMVTLDSGVPYARGGSQLGWSADYYRFVVSTNAVRAQFELNNLTADLALVARKGLPVPGPSSYDYFSANPGTNDELIVVYDYSTPVPVTPGEWFLTAVNRFAVPADYSIQATEFFDHGTNILVTGTFNVGSSFCLTWNSLPGVHYIVEAKTGVSDATWTTVGTITAFGSQTEYCVSLPSPLHFFRVREGLLMSQAPLFISSLVSTNSGILLQWAAVPGTRFEVESSPTLNVPLWTAFTNAVISTNGSVSFFDDGSQTGGLGQWRYYRLHQVQ